MHTEYDDACFTYSEPRSSDRTQYHFKFIGPKYGVDIHKTHFYHPSQLDSNNLSRKLDDGSSSSRVGGTLGTSKRTELDQRKTSTKTRDGLTPIKSSSSESENISIFSTKT